MDLKTRRRITQIEKILDIILEGLYVCDYSNNDEFFSAAEYAFGEFWSFYKGDGNIQDIEWEHVEELLSDYLNEQIRSYYDERYENCEESEELTEYPNFVYESVDDLLSDEELRPYAVFEITKPLAYMPLEYYYQEAPLWKTNDRMIFIKKGPAGSKSISTKNIKILKVFPEGNTEELQSYLEGLRSKVR